MAVNTWDRMGEVSALIRSGERISRGDLGAFAAQRGHKPRTRLVLAVESP